MRELSLMNQNLPSEIMRLRDEMALCGEAFTVKSVPNVMLEGEMTFRAQMLVDFKLEGVVVWDTSEDTEASLGGGVMTAAAITKGIRGAVISGGIRDTKQILEQKFPISYKYRTNNGALGRCKITHYHVPVCIGKVTVRPEDIIFGDIDGVICIPREIAYDVPLRAVGIEHNEVDIFSWGRLGDTISEIMDMNCPCSCRRTGAMRSGRHWKSSKIWTSTRQAGWQKSAKRHILFHAISGCSQAMTRRHWSHWF